MSGHFSVGDILVYPNYGIVEVKEVQRLEAGGQKQEFFVLETLERKKSLKVPSKTAESSGLRRLATHKEIEEIMALLRTKGEQYGVEWYERCRVNEGRLKSGALPEVAKVVRDLWFITEAHQKNSKEAPLFKDAYAFMLAEIAYVEKQKRTDLQERMKLLFKQKEKNEEK